MFNSTYMFIATTKVLLKTTKNGRLFNIFNDFDTFYVDENNKVYMLWMNVSITTNSKGRSYWSENNGTNNTDLPL